MNGLTDSEILAKISEDDLERIDGDTLDVESMLGTKVKDDNGNIISAKAITMR